MLKDDLKEWVRKEQIPVDFGLLMTLAILDKEKNDNRNDDMEARLDEASHEAVAKRAQEREENLATLCREAGLDADAPPGMSDRELFQQFLNQDPGAIYTFKKSSNVNRVLVKNHLKPRKKNKSVLKAEAVVKAKEVKTENAEVLLRLKKELTYLRPIDPLHHKIAKPDYDKVALFH